IYALCVSPGGHPVFAMEGDLFMYFDSSGTYDSLVNLTKTGLLGTEVFNIYYHDASASYWLSTGQGLFRFRSGDYGPVEVPDYDKIQVYPNPLSLSKGSPLVYFDRLAPQSRVLLYDMGGTLIWESGPYNEHGQTGQVVRWDGTNQAGRRVGPGTYYYYVYADNKKHVGKVLVVP
ncbi:MAG: T9SS type A sorting domain-containing protein, partial [Chitinivibrionales bacterium]|nr:T9SS type A sorting domain-containing protein [Chitinivibrionales bacterium]